MFKEDGIKIKIKNRSNQPITNVEFTTTEQIDRIKFDRIEANNSVNDFLSMKRNEKDGGYILSFTRVNGKKEKYISGYYTNGGSLNYSIIFVIKSDTVIVDYDEIIY